MTRPRIILMVIGLIAAGLYLLNASWLATPQGHLTILAHRGVHQTFSQVGVDNDTCTATRIDPPRHDFLENTIPSMRAAFAAGADIVEIDVHPTTGGQFVVFHDWNLDCRTNGHGLTRDHSLAEIQALDVGYGYTADGGKTYPLRGKGVGLAPSLAQVLSAFPNRRFMINIKSNDPAEGDLLLADLKAEDHKVLDRLSIYGGERPIARLHAAAPRLATFSKDQFKTCMLGYLALGWLGHVPAACKGGVLLIPQDQAWMLWGWPNRFLSRMRSAGAEVFIAGELRLKPRESILGLDEPEDLAKLPMDWRGGISTERVEIVGPTLHKSSQP